MIQDIQAKTRDAVEQQSATTTAIVHNIREIRTVVEESAAGVQDTSRSAGELVQLAGGLEKLTGRLTEEEWSG